MLIAYTTVLFEFAEQCIFKSSLWHTHDVQMSDNKMNEYTNKYCGHIQSAHGLNSSLFPVLLPARFVRCFSSLFFLCVCNAMTTSMKKKLKNYQHIHHFVVELSPTNEIERFCSGKAAFSSYFERHIALVCLHSGNKLVGVCNFSSVLRIWMAKIRWATTNSMRRWLQINILSRLTFHSLYWIPRNFFTLSFHLQSKAYLWF